MVTFSQNLTQCCQLKKLTIKWTEPSKYREWYCRDDEWLNTLLKLPLEEYHQEGENTLFYQRWTRGQVMRLLFHKTLRVVWLGCPLEEGSWPSRAEQALWPLPRRFQPLVLVLPTLTQEERKTAMKLFPVRVYC